MNRHRPQTAVLAFTAALSMFAMFAMLAMSAGCRPSEPEGGGQAQTEASPAPPPQAPAPQPAPTPPMDTAGTTSDPATSDLPPSVPPEDLPRDRPLRAAFLVVNGVYNSELMAPFDVFQHTKFHAQPGIEPFTVSPDGQPVTTFEGLRIAPAYGFQNAPEADILVVPSASGSMDKDLRNQALIDWVRQAGGRARHVVSLCDGAFVLGQAGLLDGVPATTFPDDYKRFAQMFPKTDLRINVSFVDAGKILTSQGGARSYDVAMHLVDRLYGPQVAQGVGHGLLIQWPPNPRAVKSETASPSDAVQ
ncbi:MAG TPA: DJ-1/PfpI family protein [Thermoanaerobaculia bacterium]|nr:DJ-1/PfpI family protein [Thermoanaerobaculia bacterium]